ncbi:MAG TPA: hypothetical protein ENN85_02420 [Methanoculleus sp.]|nr:hypothetical protein [Methanoculleus sp.]
MPSRRTSPILAVFGFLSLAVLHIVLLYSPATGYEISIYESTPLIAWACVIFSLFAGILIIVRHVFAGRADTNHFWIVGLLLIVLARFTFLYIPNFRGYFAWQGDHITHLGMIVDIAESGSILGNYYPLTHIVLAEAHLLTALPVEFLSLYSTAFFSVFSVIAIFLLASAVFEDKRMQLLSIAAAGGVFFSSYDVLLMPNGWSMFLIPFLLFLYFRSRNSLQYRILTVVILVAYPFFHPLSTVMVIKMLVVIGVLGILFSYIENQHAGFNIHVKQFPFFEVLLLSCIFIFWVLQFSRFEINLMSIYTTIILGGSLPSDPLADMSEKLLKVNMGTIDFLTYTIKTLGSEAIYLLFTVLATIVVVARYRNERTFGSMGIFTSFLIITYLIGILYLGYLLNVFSFLESLDPVRLQAFAVLFTPLAVAFVISYLLAKQHRAIARICVALILIASILSIISIYPSPYILQPNREITMMDMAGMGWILDSRDKDTDFVCINSPPTRYADAILGKQQSSQTMRWKYPTIPDHFGYDQHPSLGYVYAQNQYAALTKMDRIMYSTVWEPVGRFNDADFERLNADRSVNRIYDNGETEVYYITVV